MTAGNAGADRVAEALDPRAFEDHPIEQRREAAALQWAARRHIATEHAAAARAHFAALLADEAKVEKVAEELHADGCGCDDWPEGHEDEYVVDYPALARAALAAIAGLLDEEAAC